MLQELCGGHNMPPVPQDAHILISWTCKYVTLCDKRDFADVSELRILWRGSPDYVGGSSVITGFLWRQGEDD